MSAHAKTRSRPYGKAHSEGLPSEYLCIRDFEYVQPLYDLAFLLEVDALANNSEIPKYRTFSLWRAAYSLDGYGTTIHRWLNGTMPDEDLDYLPSSRISQYLTSIGRSGTVEELRPFDTEQYDRCLRLRSVRGLGPSTIALAVSPRSSPEDWPDNVALKLALNGDRIRALYQGSHIGPWQSAHVVPPLLRFLNTVESVHPSGLRWHISGIEDPLLPVAGPLRVISDERWDDLKASLNKALRREKLFHRTGQRSSTFAIKHQMGWSFIVETNAKTPARHFQKLAALAKSLDPLASQLRDSVRSDLHLHTAWSDGNAPVNAMATAAVASGLTHFAVTDHSRSSKLQSGLTPPLWLRQANALTLAGPVCPVLHGVEVDILADGRLDLPDPLLEAADLVVASVHSNWTNNARFNTDRLLRAVESGHIDVLAHPTSGLVGKPGVPDYLRAPANVYWDEVFEKCARWSVALEFNSFPARLDLPLQLLKTAVDSGCPVSIGSDAHARSHLLNLRFGQAALLRLNPPLVLNHFSEKELKHWVTESRSQRRKLNRNAVAPTQIELRFETVRRPTEHPCVARIQPPRRIPDGSSVVGIDLTAGDKLSGVALLTDQRVETCSLHSDEDLLDYIRRNSPGIVSIDSPLGLPGGGDSINPEAGIVRVAEHDLASVGIPAYPALIDSMRKLTLRGMRLRRAIEQLSERPVVIESYPGAAQDILCIPRKQKGLDLLRDGLRRLKLTGPGLETRSHDEIDAITAAIVGRYFEADLYEAMGVPAEAQLIVPKVQPLVFETDPVLCLAGKTGAGKSVVARYLALFYGFRWIRTRDVIRELLIEDMQAPPAQRLFPQRVSPEGISENHLREFGAIVLNACGQVPLREKLTGIVMKSKKPVVVDSVRSMSDIDSARLSTKPVLTWFIDCSDSVIEQRLATRTKFLARRINSPSPVDHTAETIRRRADYVISNNGSLEELRWHADDALLNMLTLRA